MTTEVDPALSRVLRHWPVLAGLGAAALVVLGMATGAEVAKALAATVALFVNVTAGNRRRA
jgi:hypothetical protein